MHRCYGHDSPPQVCFCCCCINSMAHNQSFLILHPFSTHVTHMMYQNSHIREEHRWVCAVGLHILHGVPLVDAGLIWGHPALVVTHPGQKEAAWEVVMTAGHFTGLMKRLQGRPERKRSFHIKTWHHIRFGRIPKLFLWYNFSLWYLWNNITLNI